jgi:excisionase family DNA binding protein
MSPAQQAVDEFLASFAKAVATETAARLAEELPAPTRLLTLEQVGEALGISRRSVQDLIAKGLLAAVKVGPGEQSIRVEVAELGAYIQRRRLASRSVMREDRASTEA